MSRFIKCLCIPALAIALLAVTDAPSADAGNGFSMQIGGLGISTGHGHGHGGHGWGPSIRPVYPIHGGHWGHRPFFHDTSHFDYHPPQLVPHNGHIDFVPGHYDLHRTGHWH